MEGKYSLIFMADNGKTARLRLGPALLRSLVTLLALLPIVAGVSLWLNWTLYEDRRAVLAENSLLRATVDSNAQTVARLSGLEQFLQQAAPETLGELVAVTDVPPAPDMETGTEGLTEGLAESSGATGMAPSAPSASVTSSAVAPAVAPDGSNASASAAPLLNANSEAPPTAPLESTSALSPNSVSESAASGPANGTISSIPAGGMTPDGDTVSTGASGADNVDNGFARVENLVARRVGSRSLRISFDLFNAGQVAQLAGHTRFELITKDGTVIELAAHGDTTYRINRLKKIVGNPSLPVGVTDTNGASVRVSIFADKELIFRITTPLQ